MCFTRTLCSHAGVIALIAIIAGDKIHQRGYAYVFDPMFFVAVIMMLLLFPLLVNNSSTNPESRHPVYWVKGDNEKLDLKPIGAVHADLKSMILRGFGGFILMADLYKICWYCMLTQRLLCCIKVVVLVSSDAVLWKVFRK